ncbi:Lactose-proton symport [Raoultella planticola]|uniref:Lactose-proton symport n=1 Tax=Raoultella planticola TaxID=575 RepID=A0A485A7C0_RAOPL|nr:Lactose-proton symport [Raoultella planticola]
MLHMFEVPFLLVGTFKYISSAFNPKLSATLFLIGFNLSKQLSGVVLSAWVGACTTPSASIRLIWILGSITLGFTVISLFTLKGSKRCCRPPAITTPRKPQIRGPLRKTGREHYPAAAALIRVSPSLFSSSYIRLSACEEISAASSAEWLVQPDLAIAGGLDNQPGQRREHLPMQAVFRFVNCQECRRARAQQRYRQT